MGKLEVLPGEISPALPKNRDHIDLWPFWTVTVMATRSNGVKLKYQLHFDHFRGELTGINMLSDPSNSTIKP